ncbi:MAG: DNA-processing protein DprA [Burkholderiales bacterium]|nr:DNA-processing protein DprA [Burkholderiales bacterium]
MVGDHELDAWLRLSLTPGVGDVAARRLLAAFGLPEQVFAQPEVALRQVVSAAQTQALLTPPAQWAQVCETTHAWLASGTNRFVLTLADTAYPAELLEIADPPLLLYALGDVTLLSHPKRLAVVGSRNPTAQGELTARDMCRSLAASGVCIVSGLALGIDGAAHEGALDAAGSTIAVVGTGLDRVYPRRHLDLAHRMALHGLLISEFPLGTSPTAANFPKRNRIIAGLSQGTLVVEAALASGSLITARCAADMGRDVLAIPGSIHSTQAKGCHALIRQGAKLVETAQDVLEELRLTGGSVHLSAVGLPDPFADEVATADQAAPEDLGAAPADGTGQSGDAVLDSMGHVPIGLDAIQARTGLSTATLQARLLDLELDGHLARMPGGLFQRVVRT